MTHLPLPSMRLRAAAARGVDVARSDALDAIAVDDDRTVRGNGAGQLALGMDHGRADDRNDLRAARHRAQEAE